MMEFRDRVDAGQQLAEKLAAYRESDAVVLALPRGGVVVGVQVARALHVPLDVIIARKIGHPQAPEYAICAVTESGSLLCNEAERARVDDAWFERAVARERAEARRRREAYQAGRSPTPLAGKIAILVDDGIATGLTMRAAILEVKAQRPREIIIAIPVIPPETATVLRREVAQVITVDIPPVFLGAVGAYYQDFRQVEDEEVMHLLHDDSHVNDEQPVTLAVDGVHLPGMLGVPPDAKGIVLFAHGSGSSRLSPRNNYVARVLRAAGVGTLLFDLLTAEEDRLYEHRFDIPLLTRRLIAATGWLGAQAPAQGRALGYFGASTGSASALEAAAEMGSRISAVVSRGGRPDLALPALPRVTCPVLLIVGGADDVVIDLNRTAYEHLQSPKELLIVPHATHLFEEPGTLEEVARQATDWFTRYL